jgi:hypothetical protein
MPRRFHRRRNLLPVLHSGLPAHRAGGARRREGSATESARIDRAFIRLEAGGHDHRSGSEPVSTHKEQARETSPWPPGCRDLVLAQRRIALAPGIRRLEGGERIPTPSAEAYVAVTRSHVADGRKPNPMMRVRSRPAPKPSVGTGGWTLLVSPCRRPRVDPGGLDRCITGNSAVIGRQ